MCVCIYMHIIDTYIYKYIYIYIYCTYIATYTYAYILLQHCNIHYFVSQFMFCHTFHDQVFSLSFRSFFFSLICSK